MAELHGKTPELERLEDVLTSQVFGLVKYMEIDVLLEILQSSVNFSDGTSSCLYDPVVCARFFFWPKIYFDGKKLREPDILIFLEHENGRYTTVIIEAKYHSGKSNIPDEYELNIRDQLFEEMQAVTDHGMSSRADIEDLIGKSVHKQLIYVTAHELFPEKDKDETENAILWAKLNEIGLDQFFWLNWQTIYEVLSTKRDTCAIAEDLCLYLERKGFTVFNGFENLDFSDVKTYQHYFMEEEIIMAEGKEIKRIYNAMKDICRETSRLLEIVKESFENMGYRSLGGNSVMWDTSTHYKSYEGWLPYFQQMVFSMTDKSEFRAVGINIMFDDSTLKNTIPFVSCGLIEGDKPFGTSDEFYSAGWDKYVPVREEYPFYITDFNNDRIRTVRNYFIPLDNIKNKDVIDNIIVRPLHHMYNDQIDKATALLGDKILRREDLIQGC